MLLALRRRLTDDRAGDLTEAARPLERHSLSPADTATDEFDHDMLLAALSSVQDRMFEVDAALRRIESRSYGICELTGRPIPPERLRAIPWTRFTEAAAEQLEHQQSLNRPHLGRLGSARRPGAATLAPGETVEDESASPTGTRPGVGRPARGKRKTMSARWPTASSSRTWEGA